MALMITLYMKGLISLVNSLTKTMSQSISNFEIGKVFKEINNDDLNKIFLGVFLCDKINKLVMFEKVMPGKNILS